jgi:DNA polymerase-3 subunit delta'
MTTATGFNAIVGQRHPIGLLKTFIRNGTLPHALLFTGDDGVGKRMTAAALAMACNCRTLKSALVPNLELNAVDACGECAPCKKIIGGHHPDIIHITPIASVIKIDQIRALLQQLSLKPNEAHRRVVTISNAQSMNPESGNALLKVLEEPPDRTLIILTARQTADLLPTIVSRCRHIHFSPLDMADIAHLLITVSQIDAQTAHTVAGLCGGSYTRALQWVDAKWLRRREWIIHALDTLLDCGAIEVQPWLAFSEMLAKRKELVEESLEIITMWLRDILVTGWAPAHVFNQDRLDVLNAAAQKVKPAKILKQIEAVNHARESLQSNTNLRLTLDAMVLSMSGASVQMV